MNNSSQAFWYCRAVTAVTVLAVSLSLWDFRGLVGAVIKYALFLLLTLFVGFDFKAQRGAFFKRHTVFCLCLMLTLTVIISFVLPSREQEVRLDPIGIISVTLLAPVFEELFFRGALIQLSNSRFGLIFSSVVFALFHGSTFFQALLLGLALSYFYISSKRITVSILCHMANNILALVCMGYDIRIPVLILSVALAVITGVKYEKKVL